MAEITIRAKANNWLSEQDRTVKFHQWHQDCGIAVNILVNGAEKTNELWAEISKEDAIALAQMILQNHQLSFTPNPVS